MQKLSSLILLAWLTLSPQAWAINEDDLLPVEQAFVLSAQANSANQIDIHWEIAPDYYLYRHRTDVQVVSGFNPEPLQLPHGEPIHDEFFGDVETFRQQLLVTLNGTPTAQSRNVSLKVKFQGCADAGICYPPQTRTLDVSLPETASAQAPTPALPTSTSPLSTLLNSTPTAGLVDATPLPAEQAFQFEAIVGDGNNLLLRLTPAPGYYIYRDNSHFALENVKGIQADKPQWPTGQAIHDEHFGDVIVYFEQIDLPLPLLREHTQATPITLVATLQGCQNNGICYPPMTRKVSLNLPAGQLTTPPTPIVTAAIPTAPAPTNTNPIETPPATTPAEPLNTPETSPASPTTPIDTPIQTDATTDNNLRSQPPTEPLTPHYNLWLILAAALLGGLILNLMPCVLPVLSLKVMGLMQSGSSHAHARRHALWYTLGVLSAFTVIGALVISLGKQWGFQLQYPWFIAALAYLMFAMGLSLSGLFTLGSGKLTNIGQSLTNQHGRRGDFFTGVLACIVASPCVGPFMMTALGFALTASPAQAMLVFLLMGLGLALPFLLIGYIPALAKFLPKPGAWMETFKQILAFPLYLTAVWLLWVLGRQRGIDAAGLVLVGAVLLTFGLWWLERSRWHSKHLSTALATLIIILSLIPIWGIHHLKSPTTQTTQDTPIISGETIPYSPQLLNTLRAEQRIVFVNMTADWCITCKANEATVLSHDAFKNSLKAVDAIYLKGDWTDQNPEISAFLEEHKAVGVPLYVVYGRNTPPQILPAILTQDMVNQALQRAAQ